MFCATGTDIAMASSRVNSVKLVPRATLSLGSTACTATLACSAPTRIWAPILGGRNTLG